MEGSRTGCPAFLSKYIVIEGKLILSTCRNGGGYFAPSDGALGVAEIRSFIATLNNRAVNTQKALTAARKALGDGDSSGDQ